MGTNYRHCEHREAIHKKLDFRVGRCPPRNNNMGGKL